MSNVKVYVPKKVIAIILGICLAVLCVTSYIAISNTVKYNSYVTVNAEVVHITNSNVRYITLKYEYDNKEYTADRKVGSTKGYSQGDRIDIKCNPNNPEEINDDYVTGVLITISCLLALFSVGLIILLMFGKKARPNKFNNYEDFISKNNYF